MITLDCIPIVDRSVARPFLYTLTSTLSTGDAMNTTIGVRSLVWDADVGLRVNGQPTKLRGWCNHGTFGGVGAAVPDRIDLLRIQQMRGAGGNAWRAR